ncbi:MAG TPA: adenosylcobalamin-dependent ribonucleoside-diphosphate reductase, partial [Candidatus Levybacteria bacterium]|nr:adenosylcobalamin-dependent ribonucleoside-diphosphate reductase [Candidatus Levybacteria bacterium]
THDIVQQGGSRRGSTMLMLWDWHPDVEEFITVKQDLTKINGANLSVCISDAFMEAVKADADWQLVYPDLDDPMYDEKWNGDIEEWRKLGGKVNVHKTVKARDQWNLICEAAWRSAEPGLHFMDRSNKRSNTWYFERLIATNPCGEQPLGGWAVCNLGAMNLSAYVKGYEPGKAGTFDFEEFGRDVKVAMRLLDNVIDQTYYFFKENEKSAKDIRRTGLGIMGLGDALIKMQLAYGSDESLPIIGKIFETLRDSAYDASSGFAKEKGSFPQFDKEKYLQGYHIKALPLELQKKIEKQGIRNAVLLTIAPTGTTSLVSGVSSGVEPVYEFAFKRKWRGGEDMMYHPLYEEWLKLNPESQRPNYFVSANDLTPEEHVKVQAVAQEYIDSSISKTVNAPNAHTVEDVKRLYMMAYDQGLKGITYMRDGSRQGVLERVDAKKEEKNDTTPVMKVQKRPVVTFGATYETETPFGHSFITINSDKEGTPFEVFINSGKSGSDVMAMSEALGRIISMVLRMQSPVAHRERIRKVIDQMSGIGGARTVGFGVNRVRSVPDALAKVLAEHFEFKVNGRVVDAKPKSTESNVTKEETVNGNGSANGHGRALNGHAPVAADVAPSATVLQQLTIPAEESSRQLFDLCPECGGASLAREEGCKKCYACGYAEC